MPTYQTVIIFGAPRSGTNMLRDAVCQLPGFATWPCDELNPLWRTGNAGYPNDAIPSSRATSKVQRRIRAAFDRQAKSARCGSLVEKTCANCLRPEFVRQCFPEAKFLQIVRNAVDTTSSTLGRWDARMEPGYLLKKVRFVPWRDLPRTGFRAISRRVLRSRGAADRPWGPILPDEVLPEGRGVSAVEYAALQWAECVRRVDAMLEGLEAHQACSVRYEDFVEDPSSELARAADRLQWDVSRTEVDAAVSAVHRRSVGRGRGEMDSGTRTILEQHASDLLSRHGYSLDVAH